MTVHRPLIVKLKRAAPNADFVAFEFLESFEKLEDGADASIISRTNLIGEDPGDRCDLLAWPYTSAMGGYYIILSLFKDLLGFISVTTVEKFLKPFLEQNGKLIDSDDLTGTFSLKENRIPRLFALLKIVGQIPAGTSRIERMMLASIVSTFDAYMMGALRLSFKEKPELLDGAGVSLTGAEIRALKTQGAMERRLAEKKIDQLSRSHDALFKYFEESLSIEFRKSYPRYSDVIEIIERRNVFLHNDGFVSDLYLDRCKAAGVKNIAVSVGDSLPCGHDYVSLAVDIMTDAGCQLLVACASKIERVTPKDICLNINEVAFQLLQAKQFRAAAWIFEGLLDRFASKLDNDGRRFILLNLANAIKKMGDTKKWNHLVDGEDWSGSSETFRLCVAALKEDEPEFSRRVKTAKLADGFPIEHFVDWPIFDWLRNSEQFSTTLVKVYGQKAVAAQRTLLRS